MARQLDWERQNEYNLNISVTDGVHTVYTQLNVTVIDINDHRPEFSQQLYRVEISESVPVGTEILRLQAVDKDSDGKVIFSLHAAQHGQSLRTFRLDSITGAITLAAGLDRYIYFQRFSIIFDRRNSLNTFRSVFNDSVQEILSINTFLPSLNIYTICEVIF